MEINSKTVICTLSGQFLCRYFLPGKLLLAIGKILQNKDLNEDECIRVHELEETILSMNCEWDPGINDSSYCCSLLTFTNIESNKNNNNNKSDENNLPGSFSQYTAHRMIKLIALV